MALCYYNASYFGPAMDSGLEHCCKITLAEKAVFLSEMSQNQHYGMTDVMPCYKACSDEGFVAASKVVPFQNQAFTTGCYETLGM